MKIHGEESMKLSHFLLYNETININERFTSQTLDNRSVAVDKPLKINLFYRNGNHYDSHFVRNMTHQSDWKLKLMFIINCLD